MTDTISGHACRAFIKHLQRAKIDPALLVEGLPLSLTDFHNPYYRMELPLYHQVCQRFAHLLEHAVPDDPSDMLAYFVKANSALMRLLEVAPLSTIITDLNGQVIFVNKASAAQGLAVAVGESLFAFLERNGNLNPMMVQSQIAQQQLLQSEWLGDSQQWFDSYGIPIYVSGQAVGLLFVNLNITKRKGAENQLQRRLVQLKTLAQVIAEIKTVMDLPQLVQYVCQLLKDNFGLYHAHIYLLDDSGEALVIEGGAGETGQLITESRRFFALDDSQKGIIAQVARSRQYYLSNDVTSDPHFLFNPFLPATRSELAIPIMVGDYLIGVLDLQSDQVGFFVEDDFELQHILADQIAVALQNAELYENILQQWEITNAFRDIGMALDSRADLNDILRRIMMELQRILPYQMGAIWLKDSQGLLRLKATYGLEQTGMSEEELQKLVLDRHLPTQQQVEQANQTIIIPDTHAHPQWTILPGREWVRSWVACPIYGRESVIGQINLDHGQPHFFQKQHEYILDTVVRQIALVIENHLLFEAERSQREIAETLSDIGLVLTSQLDLESVTQLIVAQVGRLLPYEAAAVWLDRGEGVFKPVLHFGYERFGVAERMDEISYQVDQLYLNKTPIIPDTQTYPAWKTEPGFEWLRSWAAAPIIRGGQIVGQLVLDHSQPNFYNDSHRALLTSLATHISIAINNAQLFEAERRRRQEIELLQRGNLSLTASLELSSVLDAILNAVAELAEIHASTIFLYENGEMRFGAGVLQGQPMLQAPLEPQPGGLIYTVAESGQMTIVEDAPNHPTIRQRPEAWFKQFAALISLPLKFGERVVGVMNLYFKTRAALHQVEISTMQLLATQASIAVENARLFQAVQDYAALLETRVNERTAELEQQRSQLQAILDWMGEGVIYYEADKIQYVNKVFRRMLGYAMDAAIPDAIIGRDVLSPHVDYDAWEDEVEQHLQQQGLWQSELTLSRLDGSQLTAYVYITAVYNPDGQQRGIVSILRDISQAKRLQEQKDRFISNASHELRTPITNIQTRLFLIRKRPEHTQEHLKVIEDVTKHMADLIKDLLDLSRFERGIMHISRTTVVVQDLLQQVIQVQQAEALQKDIQLSLLAPPDPLILALDASRMTQVLTNLIINAISYTDPQGSVTVTLQPLPSDQLLIEVADTGIGIAPDLLNQVFQPFFRAQQGKGSGAGLGLNIAKEIVEAHGGQLQVRSELNNGSVFSILLPMITP